MANPRFWDGGVPWVTPKDMKSPIIESSEMSVTQLALEKTRLRRFPKNSILIVGRSGILKRTLPVSVSAIECTVNQDLKVIVPFLPELSPFVRLMLRGHEASAGALAWLAQRVGWSRCLRQEGLAPIC